jgi:hypothetical protein
VLFPNNDATFQDNDLAIHKARIVQSCFEEHEDALQHLWLVQLPHLNIIKPLWSVLESRVRSRIPPLSLKQIEEWYSILLGTIQNLHESISSRIQAALQAMLAQLLFKKRMVYLSQLFQLFLSLAFTCCKVILLRVIR